MKLQLKRNNYFMLGIICFNLLFNYFILAKVEMKDIVPGWQIDAIPAVLGEIIFSQKRNYTQLNSVKEVFYSHLKGVSVEQVDYSIEQVKKMSFSDVNPKNYSLLGTDDKGVLDYVWFSFKLFGISSKSLYFLYYSLFLIGILCLLLMYKNQLANYLFVIFFLQMLSIFLINIRFNPQLTSILALRVFPILGIIPTYNLIFCALYPKRSIFNKVLIIFQVLILLLVAHVRFSGSWEIIAVIGSAIISLIFSLKRKNERKLRLFSSLFLICTLIGGFCIIQSFEKSSVAIEYKQDKQILKHVFWHSLYSGLAFDPVLQKKYGIKLDDVSVIEATGKFLIANNQRELWKEIGGETKDFSGIKYARYDKVVRNMFITTCKESPIKCTKAFIIYKPLGFISNFFWVTSLSSVLPTVSLLDLQVKNQLLFERQFINSHFMFLIYLALGIFFFQAIVTIIFIRRIQINSSYLKMQRALFILVGFSFVPVLVAYPIPHAVFESVILFSTVIILILIWIFIRNRNFEKVS